MNCLMCFNFDSKLQKFQANMNNDMFKQIMFVLPDFMIPESRDPIYICAPCIEQVTYFYTIRKTCLQNYCRIKDFEATLNVTNKLKFNELNIQINSNEVSTQHHHSEFKVNPNYKNVLSSEDEGPIHIKEEAQEYDDYSQQLVNDESSLNYSQNDESSRNSDDSTQHHMNVGSYEFVDVNKFTETDLELTFNETDCNDESKIQCGSQEDRFKFSEDDKAFTKQSDLENHPHVHTEKKPHKCLTCNKTFKQLGNFKRHKLTHTGEKPFECDVCHKMFCTKYNLNIHKLIHTGEKPHECDVCHKTFNHEGNLHKHKLTHSSKTKTHECDVCHKMFYDKHCLNQHQITHTDEKPYECDICHKTFKIKYLLNRHKVTHKDEKTQKCDVCHKSFYDKYRLNTHKIIHTGVKPHECVICHKTFRYEHSLKKHIFTHTDKKI